MLKPLDTGTEDSDIALLLDFPHKDATYKGDLLSGRAGYTLHQLLNNAGIAINQCFITYCHDVQENKGLINTKGAFSEQGLKIKDDINWNGTNESGYSALPAGFRTGTPNNNDD